MGLLMTIERLILHTFFLMPIAQAVFRYLGEVFTKSTTEETTHTELTAYVLPGRGTAAPRDAPPPGPVSRGSSPSAEALPMGSVAGGGFGYSPMGLGAAPVQAGSQPPSPANILIDAGNAERIFHFWFGPPSYDRLSVVVGGAVTMASLPGVVYGDASARQVSLEWWDNTVTPASFHDEWLSSGFADFSAALYDLTAKPAAFREHWQQAREALLVAPEPHVVCEPGPCPPMVLAMAERRAAASGPLNQAGPVWMGLLNDTSKTRGASGALASTKGGFVLHMLRCMMWEPESEDADFRTLMRDYIRQYANRAVSTEEFKHVVEQHMKPAMDLDSDHTMDWFFNEWIYGTDIPSYSLEYSVASGEDGKTLVTGKLKQSGVLAHFAMPVPIFGDFAGKKVRIGVIPIHGNATAEFKVTVPSPPQSVFLNLDYDVLANRQDVRQIK